MRGEFKVLGWEKNEAELTMVMAVSEWQTLAKQLRSIDRYPPWPASKLIDAIDDMVGKVSKREVWYPAEEK